MIFPCATWCSNPAASCRWRARWFRLTARRALVLANAQGIDRQVFFRKLLGYGAIVTVLAPVVLWLIFIVVPG